MTEEVLIPKMKRLEKQQRKLKIPMLNVALILFCTLLLVCATFLNINIKHYILPLDIFSNKSLTSDDFIYSFYFIPQIPMVMFICSILGKKMSATSIIFYIIGGLCLAPIFALGGGIRYVTEYSFGYIFAYLPAVLFAGNILKKAYSFKNMIFATILGVLIIHIFGIIYMIFIALLKHDGGSFISGWIKAQSGLKIVYDLVISFVAVLIGKYIHSALKFIIE